MYRTVRYEGAGGGVGLKVCGGEEFGRFGCLGKGWGVAGEEGEEGGEHGVSAVGWGGTLEAWR